MALEPDPEAERHASWTASTLRDAGPLTPARRALAADPVTARLVERVAEAPWSLRAGDRARAAEAGLDDAAVLQVVLLESFAGYERRVAAAIAADPAPAPDRPPLPRPAPPDWPFPERAPLSLAMRPQTAAAVAAWREHALEREAPLSRSRRGLIARTVAEALGDLDGVRQNVIAPRDALEVAISAYAELLTRAPWRLGAAALAPLGAGGLDDAALSDVIATAAYATFASRTAVALAALGRP